MPVDLYDRRIDHGIFHVRLVRARLEKPDEDIGCAPISKTPKGRAPIAEMRRKVTPRATRAGDPEHRLHKPTIVAAAPAGVAALPQTVRFHPRPLGVRQNIAIHPKRESLLTLLVNPHKP